MKKCPRCKQYNDNFARFCTQCGTMLDDDNSYKSSATPPPPPPVDNDALTPGPEGKSRGVAALLAIFLGAFGIQYLYLNRPKACAICLALGLVTCGAWQTVMLIQGIVMLCMSNEEFRRKYILSQSIFPLF